jgi:hypothetical protein
MKKVPNMLHVSVKADSIFVEGRHQAILVVMLMALASLLMLFSLGKKSFWLDESFSFFLAQQDWTILWRSLLESEANMSLYYILLHLWMNLGQSEFALRSLSVIFALATVPVAYAIGTCTFGKRVGIISALLLTVNAFFIKYAQEARSYSLVLLLVTLSSYFFVKGVERPSWKLWIAYIISSALAAYAHFYACLILIAHAMSLSFLRRAYVPWRGLLISGLNIFFLLIPLGSFVMYHYSEGINWIPQPNLMSIFRLFGKLVGGSLPLLIAHLIACFIAFLFAVKSWLCFSRSLKNWHYGFFLTWLFVPIFISYSFSFIKPVFWPRYLIVCLPPLVFFTALGLSFLNNRRIFVAVLIIFLVFSGNALNDYYKTPNKAGGGNWRLATRFVLSMAQPGDTILFHPNYASLPFDYYLRRLKSYSEIPDTVLHSTEKYIMEERSKLKNKFFEVLPVHYSRVWLVARNISKHAETNFILSSLQDNYNQSIVQKFKIITVILYQKTPVEQS